MALSEISFGRLKLQPGRQLLADGAPLQLRKKPLEVLTVLANANGALVTKDELIKAVWPSQVVEESALQVHIVALRKALGPEAERLKTVHGFGYRLEVSDAQAVGVDTLPNSTLQPSIAVLPLRLISGSASRN